jgi:hypothetical protein
MSDIEARRDDAALMTLAAAIRERHQRAAEAFATGVTYAREAGRLLADARTRIPHGCWIQFVEETCGLSRSTAAGYLRIHERWAELEPHVQRVAHLPLRQALALLADSSDDPAPEMPASGSGDAEVDRVLREASDGNFDADFSRTQAELSVLRRALEAPDLTVAEAAAIARRAAEINERWFAVRCDALSNLGVLLNWADANGWGPIMTFLDEHPDAYPDFLRLCDERIAELGGVR